MATEIGSITALIGTATATAIDGTVRNLQVGDKVYQNDIITTGVAGAIEIVFDDGSVMDLGRSSQAVLDLEVFDPDAPLAETVEPNLLDDIDAIQQALLEGEDPTQIADPAAAGADGEGSFSEGSTLLVERDYLNPQVTPGSGFDTTGPGNTINFFIETPAENRFGLLSDDPGILPPIDPPGPNAPVGFLAMQTVSLSEANLATGTAPDASLLTKTGSFTISAPDGLDTLTIDGQHIIQNGELVGILPEIQSDSGNSLTITGVTIDDDGNYVVSYEYTLNDAIDHQNSDEAEKTFEIVARDKDGDSATGTLHVNVADDKPLIEVSQPELVPGEASPINMIVHERFLADGDAATRAVASLDASQFFDANYGADGFGGAAYAFEIDSTAESGLTDSLTGEAVQLRFKDNNPESGIVEGYVIDSNGDEQLVLSLSLDSVTGQVELEQFRAVYHDDPTDPLQSLSPATFNPEVIKIVLTITDSDGDSAQAEIDLGVVIAFTDDGPTAENYSREVANTVESVTGQFEINVGADGGGLTALNGIELVFNEQTGWSQAIETEYGWIAVTKSGQYEYLPTKAELLQASVLDSLRLTVTDGDGDTAEFDAEFTILPETDPGTNSPVTLLSLQDVSLSEANLANGTAPNTSLLTKTGIFVISAPDALASLSIDGENIIHNGDVVDSLPALTSESGNTLVITDVTIDDDGNYVVSYEYTLNEAINHADGDDAEKTFQIVAQDSDGDTATGTLHVNVADDKPQVIATQPERDFSNEETAINGLTVHERFLADGDDTTRPVSELNVSQFFNSNYGADGPGSAVYSFEIDSTVESGLLDTLTGEAVQLRFKDNDPESGIVEGYVQVDGEDQLVFNLSIQQDGSVRLEQFRAVYHDDPADPLQALTPATFNPEVIRVVLTTTDSDGDSAQASIDLGVVIAFTDDGPTAEDYSRATFNIKDTITGQFDIDVGADGGGLSSLNGEELVFDAEHGWSQLIETEYGAIRVTKSGEYAYQPTKASLLKEPVSESFDLRVTDGDGDTADFNAEFTILPEMGTVVLSDSHQVLLASTNDILVGDDGQDIFVWLQNDQGTVGAPAVDTVVNFNTADGDVLNLADLLQGEESGDLADFIKVIENSDGVLIELSPEGNGEVTQTIKLQDTSFNDLGIGGFDAASQQSQIIQTLISNGQLSVDQNVV